MALMEKSYELAAKYNNRQAVETPSPVRKAEDKKAVPVKQVHNEVVSSLSRPMSDEEFISAFSGERNAGFNTAVGRKTVTEGNTIAACVHGTQTVSDGQALRLRLTEPMSVAGRFIPKGTVLVGGTRIQGERLEIMPWNTRELSCLWSWKSMIWTDSRESWCRVHWNMTLPGRLLPTWEPR